MTHHDFEEIEAELDKARGILVLITETMEPPTSHAVIAAVDHLTLAKQALHDYSEAES